MHLSKVPENRINVSSYSLRSFVHFIYSLVVYIYLVDITSTLFILRKHIMAVVLQRFTERTLSTKSVESINLSLDSEDSCEAEDEIKRGGEGLRLSFGKVAQKRNLRVDDNNEEQPRGAKSPTIVCSYSSPSLLLPPIREKSYDSVLTEAAIKTSNRSTSEFKLRLTSTTSQGLKIKDFKLPCSGQKSVPQKLCGTSTEKLSSIKSEDLAEQLMSNSQDLLVMDCRSFMKYNSNHVVTAVNACCTNPTIRKRFNDGKIGILELISGAENKMRFQEVTASCLIVIYDDDSVEGGETGSLSMIASRLVNHNVKFLDGGLKEFMVEHSHLCSQPSVIESRPLLFSPTSPYIDAAIDSTVMTEILPHLFLGNEKDASNMERLQVAGITHILNVSTSIPLFCELQRPGSFTSLRLPASDSGSQNIKQYFELAIDFIESAHQSGGRVLVHCQAGVSRSPTITIAYLMTRFGHPPLDAFGLIKSKRAIVSPNINFMGQLLEYESRLRDIITIHGNPGMDVEKSMI